MTAATGKTGAHRNRAARAVRARFSRLASALSLVAALLLALPLVAARARADAKLDLTVGFDNNYRANAWTPLTVRITNAGVNGPAKLQVLVRGQQSSTQSYSQPVRLRSGGSPQQETVYYFQPDNGQPAEVTAQLVVDGRVLAEKKVAGALQIQEGQPAILALTQDQSGLNFLSGVDLGIAHRSAFNNPNNPYNPYNNMNGGGAVLNGQRNPTRVLYPRGSLLPDNAFGYKAVDAVLLGDLSLDSLSEDQWSALVGWVHDGGVLVVSGGADVNRARSKMLADILPITVTGVRQVRALPSLGQQYGAEPKLTSSPVLTGTLKQDATYLAEDGDQPTVSMHRVGNGVVVLTTFDLLAPEFRAWTGQPRFWQDTLQRTVSNARMTEAVRTALQPVQQFRWGGGPNPNAHSLTDALAGVQSNEAPSFQIIGLFLLAYIIFLVPVNYLLLRRWDKKELAWITAPVIILLFSTGAYAVGYHIKGGELYLHYASVIEGAAGADGYDAYTVASIFSPRQARYDVDIADPVALPSEVTEGSEYERAATDLTVERDQKTTIRDALVNMWDHRTFDFESHLNLGGAVTASFEPIGGTAGKITLLNQTGHTLTDCTLSFRGNETMVGTLGNGDTRTVRINLTGGNGATGIAISGGMSTTGSQAEMQIKQALANIASASTAYDPATGQNVAPFVLTGWFNDEVAGLSLEGEHPHVTAANLLVIHLPTPNGFGPVPRIISDTLPPTVGNPSFGRPRGIGRTPPPIMGTPFNAMQRAQQANTLNNQAYTYVSQGRLDLALRAANQALRLEPRDGNIMDTVAEMHQRCKEYKVAAQLYVRALRLQPNGGIAETHEKYGETLLALGRKQEAIAQLQIAAQSPGDPHGAKAQQLLQKLGAPVNGIQ